MCRVCMETLRKAGAACRICEHDLNYSGGAWSCSHPSPCAGIILQQQHFEQLPAVPGGDWEMHTGLMDVTVPGKGGK